MKQFFILLFGIIILFSCTVQKRTYNKGYFVQWNKSTPKTNEKSVVSKSEIKNSESEKSPSSELSLNLDDISTSNEIIEQDAPLAEKKEIPIESKESNTSIAIKIEKSLTQNVPKLSKSNYSTKTKEKKNNKLKSSPGSISFFGFIVIFFLGSLLMVLGILSGTFLGIILSIVGIFFIIFSIIMLFLALTAAFFGGRNYRN
jgi:hypothetical protein